jgi:methionine synthase I (cobalamin-dependent)
MVITDGAWGTQLQAAGLAPGELPDLWNLTRPDKVAAVARAYAEAGSEIVLTNTFRAHRLGLAPHGMVDRLEAINRAGVEISRSAGAKVYASIGPSGRMRGDVSDDELHETFAEQVEALSAADGLVIETMSDVEEAVIAVRAAKAAGLPVVVSAVFDSGRNRDRTVMGQTPERFARALIEAGADVVGANCGAGPESYVPVCRRLAEASERPVWIKPNAGLPELEDGRAVYRMTAEWFADCLPALAAAGAGYAGGCCGTTPAFIRELARRRQGLVPCA